MESLRLEPRQLRFVCGCVAALVAALALVVAPGSARAASPVLEFASPVSPLPIGFTAEGGEVTAAMTNLDTVVHCSGSHGLGAITGPRLTASNWVFTGCETQGGSEFGHKCQSEGADPEEIRTGVIAAELVFIDQATHQVGMLLNPQGGVYMSFDCGGIDVKARGSFLSPVGPINKEATSFTATLSRFGALQIPSEYEGVSGERLQAIPIGEKEGLPAVTTGVELGFTVHPNVPLHIKAVTASEVEAKQREEEAAAARKKREEEEAARAAAAKKHQEEEAATQKRQEEEAAAKKRQDERRAAAKKRAQRRAKALRQCRKMESVPRRTRCETRVKKKFSPQAQAGRSE